MPFEKPDVDKWALTKAQEVNCFDGLAIGDAFRKHVLENDAVAELGRKASETRPANSEVFSDGRFPGPPFGFHWSLHLTAQSIASAFVSLPVIFMGQPLPSPSDEEIAVSRKLAERIGSARSKLFLYVASSLRSAPPQPQIWKCPLVGASGRDQTSC